MNSTIKYILNRRSVRAYLKKPIPQKTKDTIIKATLRAPTAGNLMLYSVVEVNDKAKKETLVKSCDNQPFIAKAPWVLLFLADCQRWQDYLELCEVDSFALENNLPLVKPTAGNLMLACCDALIAAQSAVIAAESLGIGSCYIGDIMENYEQHRELFNLPPYVFPITMLCFGYPTENQKNRALTSRFDAKYIVSEDTYKRLTADDFDKMFKEEHANSFKGRPEIDGAKNIGQYIYRQKFSSDYMLEMDRSVRKMLEVWQS
jgi:nitroreductase